MVNQSQSTDQGQFEIIATLEIDKATEIRLFSLYIYIYSTGVTSGCVVIYSSFYELLIFHVFYSP